MSKRIWEHVQIDWPSMAAMTNRQIAALLGVNEVTVKDWKRRDGIATRAPNATQVYAEHGTRSRYVHAKCRCEPCKTANTDYQTRWSRNTRKKSGTDMR